MLWKNRIRLIMSFSDFKVGKIGILSTEDCAIFRWDISYTWSAIRCSRNIRPVCESSWCAVAFTLQNISTVYWFKDDVKLCVCSLHMIYGELGIFPIVLDMKYRTLSYWIKLIENASSDNVRLSTKTYLMLYNWYNVNL